MTRTLHGYLWRDLVKVTLMALVVLTMLMTVLGAIEPMRKQGLTGVQVLSLFGYLVPVMLPLTLPISALFGATFVYGRFSQTNELLAAKASGISPVVLLQPPLVLGAIVTVLSLGISNWVSPAMAERLGNAVVENIGGLAYQQLLTRNYMRLGNRFIHAAEVDRDNDEIHGVVAVQVKVDGAVRLLVAPSARIEFQRDDERSYVQFTAMEVAATRSDEHGVAWMSHPSMEPYELPNLAKERATWYDWRKLHAAKRDPAINGKVRWLLTAIHHSVCAEKLSRRIIAAINGGRTYSFSDGTNTYVLIACGAELGDRGAVKLAQGHQGVAITVRRGGRIIKTVLADEGTVSTAVSRTGAVAATIVLSGQIRARSGQDDANSMRYDRWRLEGLDAGRHAGGAPSPARRIADAVVAGSPCTFVAGSDQYTLTAGWADVDDAGDVRLSLMRPVTVIVSGETDKVVTADSGTVATEWNSRTKELTTSITLTGPRVTVRTTRWRRMDLAVPAGFTTNEALATGLNAGVPYAFTDGEFEYTLIQGRAEVTAKGTVSLFSSMRGRDRRRVRISCKAIAGERDRQGRPSMAVVEADAGEILIRRSARDGKTRAAIVLSGNVDRTDRKQWRPAGGLLVPADISEMLRSADLGETFRVADNYATDKGLLRAAREEMEHLHWEIVAEMHGRIALGLSCCLLVAMGAALGLVFRGGQVLSAFALSVAPAVIAYVMVIMGKEMVTNPKVNPGMGMAAIWGGDILLILGNMYIYGRIMRR